METNEVFERYDKLGMLILYGVQGIVLVTTFIALIRLFILIICSIHIGC